MSRLIIAGLLSGTLLTVLAPSEALSQAPAGEDPRIQAAELRSAGDFRGAIAVLRSHLAAHPDDGDAMRLLAETLYWAHDVAGSRAVSERALMLHSADNGLRLQYGRQLIETGEGRRAREVLAGVDSRSVDGRADAIIGTLDYWEGDFAGADRLIRSAIASGDSDPAIRRIRTDIAILTAPWISVTPAYAHDDQPIDRATVSAEAGWFPSPSTSFAVRARGMHFQLGDTATRTASVADIAFHHYAASASVDLDLAGGLVTRSQTSSSDFVGSGSIGIRLPAHIEIFTTAGRAPYFATEASLSETVMTTTGKAALHLDNPRGWLGEAAVQAQRYPDSNTVSAGYAWLLAPLVHKPDMTLRAGYSGAMQTSAESRFALAHPQQPYVPTDLRFDLTGSYQPYYTPIDLRSHSVIAAITAGVTPAVTLNASGSYAIRATETAPTLFVKSALLAPSTIERGSYTRSFNPWNAHGSLDLAPSAALSIVVAGDVFRTGFYTSSSASVALVYRLAGRAMRMAGGY